MSAWDSISSTYVEAATSALPLHRAVIFVAGFGGSLAVRQQTHLSIFETVARIPLSELISLSTGPFSKAVFADVLIGVALVTSSWIFSRLVLRTVFALAARSTNLWERARISAAQAPIDPKQSLADRQAALELIDKSLDEPRARLRSRGSAAELIGGLGLGYLLASHWGNLLDGLLGAVLALVSISLQVGSVQLFLSDYLGPAMLKAQLQGRKPTGLTSVA
jgi:hypothetical protein